MNTSTSTYTPVIVKDVYMYFLKDAYVSRHGLSGMSAFLKVVAKTASKNRSVAQNAINEVSRTVQITINNDGSISHTISHTA